MAPGSDIKYSGKPVSGFSGNYDDTTNQAGKDIVNTSNKPSASSSPQQHVVNVLPGGIYNASGESSLCAECRNPINQSPNLPPNTNREASTTSSQDDIINELRKRLDEKDEELTQKRSTIVDLERSSREQQTGFFAKLRMLDKVHQDEKAIMRELVDSLNQLQQEEVARHQAEVGRLEKDKEELRSDKRILGEEKNKLAEENKTHRHTISRLRGKLQEAERRASIVQICEQPEKRSELAQRLSQLKEKQKEIKTKVEALQTTLKDAETTLSFPSLPQGAKDQVQRHALDTKGKLEAMQKEQSENNREVDTTEKELESLDEELGGSLSPQISKTQSEYSSDGRGSVSSTSAAPTWTSDAATDQTESTDDGGG